jgi:hypothetical protein
MSAWWAWTRERAIVVGAATAALLVGCVVDTTATQPGAGSVAAGGAGGAPAGGGSPAPMLVDVDADRTLTATPGQGVGIFTALPCSFQVDVSVGSGTTITNLAAQLLEAVDQLSQPGAQDVEALTNTTSGIDGITFDTTPGAAITLDAQVNGQHFIGGTSFLYFAQNGRPNGGYKGSVTNPLMLEPSAP